MTPQAAFSWLRAGSMIVIGVGVLMTVSALPALALPFEMLLDLVFWPFNGQERLDAPMARLLAGIGGSVIVAWGLMLLLVSVRVLPRDPALAHSLIVSSVVAWFVLDCMVSILVGAYLNVLLNLGFAALFLVPIGLSRTHGARLSAASEQG